MNALLLLINSALAEGDQRSDFWMPEQASTLASEIDSTFYFIYWVSAIFFVILMGAMIWFALAYKQKTEGERIIKESLIFDLCTHRMWNKLHNQMPPK